VKIAGCKEHLPAEVYGGTLVLYAGRAGEGNSIR
jgi:hypothetical protein